VKKDIAGMRVLITIALILFSFYIKPGFAQWRVETYDVTAALKTLEKKSGLALQNKNPRFQISIPAELSRKWCFMGKKKSELMLVPGEGYFPGVEYEGEQVYIVSLGWCSGAIPNFTYYISLSLLHNIYNKNISEIARFELDHWKYAYESCEVINPGKLIKVNQYYAYEIAFKTDNIENVIYIDFGDYVLRVELWSEPFSYKENKKDFLKIINTFKKL
jgi:hypothetical protein